MTSKSVKQYVPLVLLLILAVLAVYWQVLGNGFINYDDDTYVTANRYVRHGISLESISWAFTTRHSANWHPLTWLSHMLDGELFGMNPMGHHLTSLLLHLANTILLFLLLARMTGSVWKSGFVAALFGIHPLHVESVAWVAERKDVLSTLFWILTMWAYVRYAESPNVKRYSPVVVLFALGLMAKPMLVTLPFVLLLLDYWPLGRFASSQERKTQTSSRRLILEKIPLVVLAAASSVVTFIVQQKGQAVGSLEQFPPISRIANALASYAAYIGKTIWPAKLAVFYPHPGASIPVWQPVMGTALLIVVSALILGPARRQRYLAVGWLWYVGTLVPVIGLVQVGWQAMADRYTYVPLIGLFIMAAWGIPDLVERGKEGKGEREKSVQRAVLPGLAVLVVAALMVTAYMQAGRWKDSITLFRHALAVTSNNPVAHDNLGLAFDERGEFERAATHYMQALTIKPNWAEAHQNLAVALVKRGRVADAVSHLTTALKIDPDFPQAHNNLGAAYLKQGRLNEAEAHLKAAIRFKPDYAMARNNLGNVLLARGKASQAIEHFHAAIKLDPDLADPHYNLAVALLAQGEVEEAMKECRIALRLRPGWVEAANNLAWMLAAAAVPSPQNISEAVRLAEQASKATGGRAPEILDTLAAAYASAGRFDEAISTQRRAIDLATAQKKEFMVAELWMRLAYYEKHRVYRLRP